MSDANDSLARLIRSGNPEKTARELYPVIRRMVKSVLRGGDPWLAETATHDALLAICRYHHTFRGTSKASTWLWVVARRSAGRCAQRHRPPDSEVLLEDVETVVPQVGVPDPLSATDALDLLARAVPNPDWRLIWLLWNEPGAARTHEEVARLTGYTVGSVEATLSKIRRRIADTVQIV